MGVLKGSKPLSPPFVYSPASVDISSGPATVVFTSMVENKTDHVVTVTLDINVNHILTYYGRDVRDGEPGKPGITFKKGDAPNTKQVTYGTPFQRTITVQPKGAAPLMLSFSTVMRECGYFQFDIGKHFANHTHNTLSSGVARILGCKSQGGGGGGGTGGGGTGGVSGSSATGLVLANTGIPVAGGLVGIIMALIGGLGLRIRQR
jgi:hypothetical protein